MLVTFAIKNKVIKNLDNLFKEINLYNEKKFNVINLFKIMYLMNRMDNLKNMNNLVLKNHLTKSYHYSKRRLFIHLPSIIYGMSSQALGGSILAIFLYLVYITAGQLAAITFL